MMRCGLVQRPHKENLEMEERINSNDVHHTTRSYAIIKYACADYGERNGSGRVPSSADLFTGAVELSLALCLALHRSSLADQREKGKNSVYSLSGKKSCSNTRRELRGSR